MAKLKIFTFPDAVLAKKALPIARVEKSYYQVADDMLETMYDAPGVGLAANQVGLLERIIVVDTDFEIEGEDADEDESTSEEVLVQKTGATGEVVAPERIITKKNPRILINPQIILKEGTIKFSEGCLSVPEYSAEVTRAKKLKVQYQDVDGLTKTLSAEGFLAVALQHEIDHLDGRLFIEHLSPLKKEMVKKQLLEERQAAEAVLRRKG